MNTPCWVNGIESSSLSTLDRGLHYGDGLFETLAVEEGNISLLDYHLERLGAGCERLGFPSPPESQLRAELAVAAVNQEQAVLKLLLTRGNGGRGYAAPQEAAPARILFRYPRPDYPASYATTGVRLRLCDMRLGRNSKLAGLKHLNRLEQVLARNEWDPADGTAEGLMLDEGDLVIEGTMSNVFAGLANGVLVTPALERCGVAGVMRRHLLAEAVRAGVVTQVTDLRLPELLQAREIFLCNSLIGIWPVLALGEHEFAPGDLTRRAQGWARQAFGRGT